MYFSGFSLENEKELFREYLIENDFTVNGFSYGAIKAFEYVCNTNKRIDKLQLFSPAFFQSESEKFKKMQMMFFNKDAQTYAQNFLENCGFDDDMKKKYFSLGSASALEELLYYIWDENKLQELVNNGVKIEIYLGEEDKIIKSTEACEFFRRFGEVYFIKSANHILR